MPETLRMWVESSFNIAYLLVIWALVVLMARRQKEVAPINRPVAARLMWMFTLLALGDTGHVGFRVAAYALGGLEAHPTFVGIGALATAITVTLFYVVMVDAWRVRFHKQLGWFAKLLLFAAGVRFLLMLSPANQWGQLVPLQPWSLYRNLPLMVQGLGVAFLILRDARREQDPLFGWIGVLILASYACYLPVVLFVQAVPLLGMLMIPKTMAYVAIAILGYRNLYGKHVSQVAEPMMSET